MSERHKQDKYYKKAKRQNYRARSAYKLLDIQKRFSIFERAFYIIDIGSHPGSWLQVAQDYAEQNIEKYKNDRYYSLDHYKILGVDIKHVSPIEGVETLKMDATDPEFKQKIRDFFSGKKVDLLLSDASIKKIGNQFSDHVRQINLCSKILDLASEFLKKQGRFVVKAFRGQDFSKFRNSVKSVFQNVNVYKPKASKKHSNEIYIVAKKKR
ncbi:MAG: RlmE family RNA methyltransferase [Promethearchaeia archaeon]